ncbi:hypothetical protein VKT23_008597 [Stygiomarasmius scandens]|uniref:Uncharacterized protein n=1 Tax=Marasmiellus scandens TaxID=2682957 RepID=A0ABR1JGW4_9AGAR
MSLETFSVPGSENSSYPFHSLYNFVNDDDVLENFLPPVSVHDSDMEQRKLELEAELYRMQALYEENKESLEDDPSHSNVIEMMRQLGIDVDSPGEDPVLPTADIDNNQDYSPYPS